MTRQRLIYRSEIVCPIKDRHSSVKTGSGTNVLATSGGGLVVSTPRCGGTSNIVFLW
ncbi:uncharacterized protein METZ01_LOCUS307869, partial [marine metagenome]